MRGGSEDSSKYWIDAASAADLTLECIDNMLKSLSTGTKDTWIAIPGVGSFSSSFDQIAKSLGNMDIGLVAVEIMDVFKSRTHLQNIGDLADLIETELPVLLTESACTIIGHSFGARIAFELGRRRSAKRFNSHVVMIDALPRNLDGVREPEGTTLSEQSLLRWYISTFPPAFAAKFADVQDDDLAAVLVSARVFRRDDVVVFVDAMRRQIQAHNAYAPERQASDLVKLDIILPESGIFSAVSRSSMEAIIEDSAIKWKIFNAKGDHYSILKMPDDVLPKVI